ncbi:MAG: hypothetical protein JWN70_6285 [Planctomycetaceae bacterium]|nr:hypothetical protein [Planctomycetaceae bacterium]
MNTVIEQRQARLLAVDDDAHVRNLLSRWLTDAGYLCDRAANAQDAWSQLHQGEFDLITLDIRMPGCSGIELLKQIKQEYPDVAVVMLTGEGDTAVAIDALTSGAHGYLQKPTEKAELISQIRKALEHRQIVITNRMYTEALAERVRIQTAEIVSAHDETIHRLIRASLYRDEETGDHVRRTGEYSEILALRAGWSPENAKLIRLAAPLHDIGKIGIPDAILRKPGKLDAQEISQMQAHAILGAHMLSDSSLPMLQMAHEIALHHHEHWDGSGYPHGLAGHAIPEAARIVAIIDVFDALSHDRIYRPALPAKLVEATLKNGRGSHFDPVLLDAFLSILPAIRAMEDSNLNGGNGLVR